MAKGRKASYALRALIRKQQKELDRLLSKKLLKRWAREFIKFLKDNRVGAYKEEGGGYTNPATYVFFMRAYIRRLMFGTDFDLLMMVDSEWSRNHRKFKKRVGKPVEPKSKSYLVGIDGVSPVQMDWVAKTDKFMSDHVIYDKRTQRQIENWTRKIIKRFVQSVGDPFVGKQGRLAPEVQMAYDAFMANIMNRIALDFSFAWLEAQHCLFWGKKDKKELAKKMSPHARKLLAASMKWLA